MNFHQDADAELTRYVDQFETQVRKYSEEIAKHRMHSEVQPPDVYRALNIVYHTHRVNRWRDAGIFAGQLGLGFALGNFFHALPQELTDGTVVADRDGLIFWGAITIISLIISIISLMQPTK